LCPVLDVSKIVTDDAVRILRDGVEDVGEDVVEAVADKAV
jgi:hypothetical protein